jgi:hypothetical protein
LTKTKPRINDQPLFELLHLVHGDLAEAELFVELAGSGIASGDLERDAVGAFLPGPRPALLEESVTYTKAPVVGDDVDVFDCGPGLGLNAGEPSRSSPERKPTTSPFLSATKRQECELEERSARKRRMTFSASGAVA